MALALNNLKRVDLPLNKKKQTKPESVLENEMHWILWYLEIKKRPDLVIVTKNKRSCRIMDFVVPADHRIKLKERGKERYGPYRRTEKTVEHENDSDTNCNWLAWFSYQNNDKGTGWFGNKRTRGNHLNNCIVEIVHKAKKNPGDLRRLVVT